MPKLVKCPICGRINSSDNAICSNCGARLGAAMQEGVSNYSYKKPKKSELEKMIEQIKLQREPPKNIYDFLKPTETKLFLFVNTLFASIFLIFIIKQKLLFALLFYPSLYLFSCRWVARQNFEWQNFLMEFFLIIICFFILFSLIPS